METSGYMGKSAQELLRYVAINSEDVASKGAYALRIRYLRERLAVALWRGNTRMIALWQQKAFAKPGEAAAQA